jgi:hypothetical protein
MSQPARQLLPGVVHWVVRHPNIGVDVSSYLLTDAGVALDPLTPPDGLEWFAEHGVEPREILLTNRHHLRHAAALRDRYGCAIHASRPGLHEFAPEDGVEPFDFGQVLAGGIVAHEVGVICPDETALEIPGVRALAVADGVVNYGGLGFVPDEYIGDDPAAIKRGLAERYARLADEVDFDHLLLAHGEPVLQTGRRDLRDWAASVLDG